MVSRSAHSESESLEAGDGEKRLGRSMTPQFRVLGGSWPRHDETVETLFPVIFLGRAAKTDVGQEVRVNIFTGGSAQNT